jgi:hypothetical protein
MKKPETINFLLPFLLTATCAVAENPAWLNRPFVKVLATGDSIPGASGALFNTIEAFTLRDGKLHIVAGESQNRKGLFRWQNGQLTKLVYTDTMAPTGSPFDTVHFTTDETEGALNFVGEVFFGRPGFVYGLFEWKDGVVTKIFDTATEINGKTLAGFGYPVRVGHEVVGNGQFFEAGVMKQGIHRWDGTTLRTLVQSGDDLPGTLGGFTGQPGRYQLAFDGSTIGFVGSDSPNGTTTKGVYRIEADGSLTKVIDTTDRHPSGRTYGQRNASFPNVGVYGTNTFLATTSLIAASGNGNQFYTVDGLRYTGGTLNPATATFGTDGLMETVLLPVNFETGSPVLLDGREWDRSDLVAAHGDDVAYLVHFVGGGFAIYAAAGTTTQPITLDLSLPHVGEGNVRFSFPTLAGRSYRIDFKASLSSADWTVRTTLEGTGATLEFSEAIANGGFYRAVLLP